MNKRLVENIAKNSELELHLLCVDQVGQVVRWRDQAVRLPVADVHPPLRWRATVLLKFVETRRRKCVEISNILNILSPVLLLVICVVGTVHGVGDPGFAYSIFVFEQILIHCSHHGSPESAFSLLLTPRWNLNITSEYLNPVEAKSSRFDLAHS